MLFDPKWELKTKPTFAGFVAWLEKQPADKEYAWGDCRVCAIAQYVQSLGIPDAGSMHISFEEYRELEGGQNQYVAMSHPHTFGAALARARALQAATD